MKKAICVVSFLITLDFIASYAFGTGQPQSSNRSQLDSPVYSHTNPVGMGRRTTSQSHLFFWDCCISRPLDHHRSYIFTSTILPLIISSKPCWCLNLKQNLVGWSHPDPHLARPTSGELCHRFVFSRSQVVPLSFITIWSLFRGGVCKAVIGSRWGGPCMPPWWCQLWWREKHGGMGMGGGRRGGGMHVSQKVWEAADSLQVYRWGDWQKHRCKSQPKSSRIYQRWRNNLF